MTIARIQKLQQTPDGAQGVEPDAVLNLWRALVEVIESQLTFLVTESAYRCQLIWAPTYPALTIAFISKYLDLPDHHKLTVLATFAIRVARWHPTLINRRLVLQRVRQILEYLKKPPYPDIHRTVQIFVNYAGALLTEQDLCNNDSSNPQHGAAAPLRSPEIDSASTSDFNQTGAGPSSENPMLRVEKEADLTASSAAEPRPEPVLPRLLGYDIPNWNLTAPIADSFDLFEEGQTDIFDFLPDLCRT